MRRFLLLTGATGLVGRYLLRDLLARGIPVAALVRPRGPARGPDRLARIMAAWADVAGPHPARPICLEGDVNAPGLGLSAIQYAWVARHCGRALHAAASLTFRGPDPAGEPWRTNREGTRNVLDFCRRTGIGEFHYVSTAYVCGLRDGVVREDEPTGGSGFRNDYEQSKADAEAEVRAAGFLDRLTVYRPAVVVGDSRTGFTSSYHGLYRYLQFIAVLRRHAAPGSDGRWSLPIRLNLTGDEGRNLVPVDWVSGAVAELVSDTRSHGQTYHLTPSRSVTVRELEAAAAEFYGYHGPTFVGPHGLADGGLNETERRFYEAVSLYEPYWVGEPEFDRTNTLAALPHLPCPEIDRPMLHRLLEFAVRDRWGKPARKPGP
jgi:thioester reductase-like protein